MLVLYKLTREFLEYLSDKLQIGERAPNYDFRLYKKTGDNVFDPTPTRFEQDINSIEIDRRWNMSVDEMLVSINNVNGVYSPDYNPNKSYTGLNDKLYPSGYGKAIMPYNRVEVDLGYGSEIVRTFTGQVQEVDIQERFPTINISAKNELRKLLKPIDPITSRRLKYENQRASSILLDLCRNAGINNVVIDMDEIDEFDYVIEKAVFELGVFYKDAMDTILETMGHRIFADRLGAVRIQKLEAYTHKDVEHWIFDDYIDLSQGSYKFDASIIRNRVIVQSKNSWKAYEDPFLIDMANGERLPMGIEVPWAETDEQKIKVADHYFLQMRRKLRRLTIATIGNPTMDTGDLARLKMLTSTANDKYMITSIRTSLSDSGYIDIVDLELAGSGGSVAVEAEGNYTPDDTDTDDASTVKYGSGDKIVDEAKKWIGTYYQWGGDKVHNSSHYGFDCSHFTYVVYKKFGLMDSYRTSATQKQWAKSVSKSNLQKGDLVFYTNSSGRVNHVGIYIGGDKVISASGGGSKTTTIGRARQQNAKVKIHNLAYRSGPYYYGRSPNA